MYINTYERYQIFRREWGWGSWKAETFKRCLGAFFCIFAPIYLKLLWKSESAPQWALILFFLFFIIFIVSILITISDTNSYIQLSDTYLILKKPINYPFPTMEKIKIPYKQIEFIKIHLGLNGWNITIKTNVKIDGKNTFKFFHLNGIKKFIKELNRRWVNNEKYGLFGIHKKNYN